MQKDKTKYKIVRFFSTPGMYPVTRKRGLTLEQAIAHCEDPTTRKAGKWFDGYTKDGKF